MNAAGGSDEGATDEEITAAMRGGEAATFSDAERAAFALADAITTTPGNVPDEQFEQLRRWYSDDQLVEIAASIAFENFRSRFNRVFDIQAVGQYCPLPAQPAADSR